MVLSAIIGLTMKLLEGVVHFGNITLKYPVINHYFSLIYDKVQYISYPV